MNAKTIVTLIFAVCVSVIGVQSKAQNLITNGDFEQLQYATSPYYKYLPAGDSTDLPGWTSIDDGVGEEPFVFNTGGYPTNTIHSGNQAVTLNQGSGITTTFAVSAGTVYSLTFFVSPNISSLDPLQVSVDGFTTQFFSTNQDTYSSFTYEFTAPTTDSAASLELFNPSPVGDYQQYLIDDVNVSAVSESSVVFLGAPGFQTNLAFGFTTTGLPGQTNVIDASTNLETWIPIATNAIPTNGVLSFLDNDASNYPTRFYRARLP